MSNPQLLADLNRVGAILRGGHRVLKEGAHSRDYVNKDGAYPFPRLVHDFTKEMAGLSPWDVDVVVGPAVGAVILSTWIAYHLTLDQRIGHDVLSVFADKDGDDFRLRRGYDRLVIGKNVLVVEDVVTSGKSLMKTAAATRLCGGNVIGAVALCNRGEKTAEFLGLPMFAALLDMKIETWTEEECMKNGPCSEGVPIDTEVGHGAAYLRRKGQG